MKLSEIFAPQALEIVLAVLPQEERITVGIINDRLKQEGYRTWWGNREVYKSNINPSNLRRLSTEEICEIIYGEVDEDGLGE